MLMEVLPKHSHRADGLGIAVRLVESFVRTFVALTEEKLRVKVVAKSSVLPWLVRRTACMITRCDIKTDGRSSWHRLKGKEFKSSLVVTGETIDHRLIRSAQAQLEARWSSGIFLGEKMRKRRGHRWISWGDRERPMVSQEANRTSAEQGGV